jgi:hypothetical protein
MLFLLRMSLFIGMVDGGRFLVLWILRFVSSGGVLEKQQATFSASNCGRK